MHVSICALQDQDAEVLVILSSRLRPGAGSVVTCNDNRFIPALFNRLFRNVRGGLFNTKYLNIFKVGKCFNHHYHMMHQTSSCSIEHFTESASLVWKGFFTTVLAYALYTLGTRRPQYYWRVSSKASQQHNFVPVAVNSNFAFNDLGARAASIVKVVIAWTPCKVPARTRYSFCKRA
jgi:hypothetical protein